jgi:1-deoxy-D-xylulose-5-phosphate synthase
MLAPALAAAEELNATVANMRFVKPLDDELVKTLAESHALLVTVEENAVMGGAGSAVAESLQSQGVTVALLHLGLPDTFIEQGAAAELLAKCGLDKDGLVRAVRKILPE